MVSEGRRLTRAALLVMALGVILLQPVPGAAQSLPELPRVFLDTTYVAPTGSVIPVPAGGDFQAALNAATPGTTLVLQAGATYTGNFTLPANPGPGWIYIQSSALASMPGGTRVTPAQAVLMPKIVTPNGSSAISSGGGSQKYRLAGLEITGTLTNTSSLQNNLVMLGGQGNHDFVLDRSYIHGQPFGNYKRGVEIEATRVAVIDSWIDDIHVDQDDTQGIIVWNGAGPLKIVNNTIRAGGENIILGPSNGTVVADVEIRGNLLEKPYSWRVGDPTFAGQHWTIKNLLELKNARRVLIDGNVLQNCWVDWNAAFGAQGASSLVLTTRNQWGTCNCPVEDVTITNNINQHLGRGIGIANLGGSAMQRILVRNNLFRDISSSVNDGIAFMSYANSDVTIDHNTSFQDGIAIFTHDAPNFWFTNNLLFLGGGIAGGGAPSVNMNNAVIGGPGNFPIVGNFFPATIAAVGFVNYAGGDYRLAPTSPYKNAGTDGKDIGADIVALNAATACAVSGACGPPPPPPPPPPPVVLTIPGMIPAASFTTVVPTTVTVYTPSSGVQALNNLTTGAVVSYAVTVAQPGTYAVKALVSNADWSPTPTWHLAVDGIAVTAPVPVPSTGTWNAFQWVSASVPIVVTAGPHILSLHADQQYFNVQAIQTIVSSTTPPTVAITSPTSSATYSTSTTPLTLGGTASDALGVTQVTWANSRGGSGTATGTTSWTAGGIVLQPGSNVLTVSAWDAAGNTGTATLTVTFPDTAPPTVTITAPTSSSTYSTSSTPLTLGGTASDNVGVTQVTWANSRGGSGAATGTTTSWTAGGIVLQPGSNVLTVSARDAAGNTGTATLTVTFPDTTPPTVTITAPTSNPTYTTSSSSLTLSGIASDNVGVTQVTWTNSLGGTGTATGTTSWTAAIVLQVGTNVLTVTTRDGAGNSATATLTVTLTSTLTFTDDPLLAQSTVTEGVHVTELRTAINSARTARGLAAYAWTDPTLSPRSTRVNAVHLTDLRTALNQAYQVALKALPTYTDPTLVAGQTTVKAIHLNELRAAVRALQ